MLLRSREKDLRLFFAKPPFGYRNILPEALKLFDAALTHDSYANEIADKQSIYVESYERLEFLGDAVIELVVCDHIYKSTDLKEGGMTDFKKETVMNKNISRKVSAIPDMEKHIRVGGGHRDKITDAPIISEGMTADSFEALVGAIYIAYGIEEAQRIVSEILISK